MQRVISRVHQIVTTHATGGDDGDGELPPMAASAMDAPSPSSSPPTPPSGHQEKPVSPTATPIQHKEITLAVERLQYATLLSERKKAVAAIQELARSYMGDNGKATLDHAALGLAAVPAVLNALVSDPRDTELMEAMLELLQELVVTSPSVATALLQPPTPSAAPTGSLRSAAAATASVSGTQICLQLLTDPSPWIRGPTITLVKHLQEAQQKEFATSVLECREGLRRLLEVVEDKREHIRDAALQVLVKMTEREKNVQQFLAFEDGFVRLFQIMEVEGLREGSSVVSDCLQIVNNMVRDNLMNQTLFRELPFLSTHLPQLLSLPSLNSGENDEPNEQTGVTPSALKSTQKKRTMKLVLQLVRFLVASLYEGVPDNKLDELATRDRARKDEELAKVQSLITRQADLMGAIGEIVCSGNEEFTDLQLQALDLIQLICSENGGNQIILVNLLTQPSRLSLLSELVKLDIAEDETPIAAAATNLLDALFTKNEPAKMAIFQHLNAPPPVDDDTQDESTPLPAGRVLLDALIKNAEAIIDIAKSSLPTRAVRTKTILTWKACHRLAFLITDSDYCKELALRVPSEYENSDAQAVAGDLFMSRCLKLLSRSHVSPTAPFASRAVFQVKVAILTLLIQWCVGCTNAVRELTGSVTNLSILVELITPSKLESELSPSHSEEDEAVQIEGLTALLLGCCLEYLSPVASSEGNTESRSQTSRGYGSTSSMQLTRHQLVALISQKVGLERFTNALIRFQQSPQVIACARAATTRGTQRARMLLPHRALFVEEDEEDEGYLFQLYDKSFTNVCRDHTDKIQQRVLSIFTSADGDTAATVSSGMNLPSAASAYQDLIRIQDKQIQDLQRQVADLTALSKSNQVNVSHSSTSSTPVQDSESQRVNHDKQLTELQTQHTLEKDELEQKLANMAEQYTALDARFQGLTKAFEQLESEHLECSRRLSSASNSINATDAMSRVMADLEREVSERRRLEVELRHEQDKQSAEAKKMTQDAHSWELTKLQMEQELDSLRSALTDRDEQLEEQNQVLEIFRQGQDSAKRSVAQLKQELESAHRQIEELQHTERNGSSSAHSNESKQEVAAQEIYQLWEKERAKVRELKEELEQLQHQCADAVGKNQQLEQQLSVSATSMGTDAISDAEKDDPIHLKNEVESLKYELSQLHAELSRRVSEKDSELQHMKKTAGVQLAEIAKLQELFKGMEEEAEKSSLKDKTIEDLRRELDEVAAEAKAQKQKSKATITELEDEIARMFFERTEQQRKSKASLKEAENEIARMFLEKVELEKQIAELQNFPEEATGFGSPITDSTSETDMAENGITNDLTGGSKNDEMESVDNNELGEDAMMEDMFILLASLEIQCDAFRECLEKAQGEQAVVTAVELSRRRGALTI